MEDDSSLAYTFVDAWLLVASGTDRRERESPDSAYLSLAIQARLDPSLVCQLHVSSDHSDSVMGHQFGFVKVTC